MPAPPVVTSFARVALSISVLLLAAGAAPAQTTVPLAERLTLESSALRETRSVLVYTPRGYDPARAYPVLYMTDGDAQLLHTAGTVDFLSRNGRMPQMIVVGISNTDRTRDLTPTRATLRTENGRSVDFPTAGGSAAFLTFVRTELVPLVERRYRTEPFRLLAGHSFGGLFTLMAFADDPAFFNAYLAVSPTLTWDDRLPVRRIRARLAGAAALNRTVVVTRGDEVELAPAFDELKALLTGAPAALGLRASTAIFEDEDHGSVVLRSHYAGLTAIFDGWRAPVDRETRTFPGGLRGLEAHYRALSTRLGWTVAPPEAVVNALGYAEMARRRTAEALAYLEWNVAHYPQSANVHDSLGEALEAAGQRERALAAFEKAIVMGEAAKDPNVGIYRQHRDRVRQAVIGKS